MIRRLFIVHCSLLIFAAAANPAAAQLGGPKLKIADVRVGFPPGRFITEREDNAQAAHVFKRNTWTPIYLTLEVVKEVPGNAWVILETPDADDLRTQIAFPLGSLADQQPGTLLQPVDFPFVPYIRPADQSGELTVKISADPEGYRLLADTQRVQLYRGRTSGTYVVLSLGSKLPGFDLPGEDAKRAEAGANAFNRGALRNGRVETAAFTNVREMPDQWFGYAAADLVVLATGSAPNDFLQDLFDPQRSAPFAAKREALFEWVRRGGRLVVGIGSNAGMLSGYESFKATLPAKLAEGEPSRGMTDIPLSWDGFGLRGNGVLRSKAETFPVARLVPDPNNPPRVLIPKPGDSGPRAKADVPVVVQSPYGLGRVTAVAFDLDRSPFLDFPDRPAFWDWLVRAAGADRASVGGGQNAEAMGWGGYYDTEDSLVARLREHVDNFEGVPVISFGWVALFIAMYTLLIGPVEYLFLKKVVGRLELTWVTFPLIVLTVSAAAYFTAYAIKGNDLKVNKVDLVDLDPASGRVYGRSWFTIFSPRIDSYTIGIEPRDGWVAAAGGPNPPRTLVDWMAGARSGGGNLVSRGYSYRTDETAREVADGLLGVPIQVWSTKAFSANWSGYLDAANPAIESRLYHPPGDPKALAGSFVNRLPVKELKGAVLVYGGVVYELEGGTLVPGEYRPILEKRDANWFASSAQLAAVMPAANPYSAGVNLPAGIVGTGSLWGTLFHERAVARDQPLLNASLRELDQSWRASDRADSVYLDQAILLAKVDASGLAEPIMTDSDGASPTRLWHKELPGTGQPRTPVPGSLRQETYIRAFLPVAPKQAIQKEK